MSIVVCTSCLHRRAALQNKLNNLRQFHIRHCSGLHSATLILSHEPIDLLLIDPVELHDLIPLLLEAPRPIRAVLCTQRLEAGERRVHAQLLRSTSAYYLGEMSPEMPVATRQRVLWLHLKQLGC